MGFYTKGADKKSGDGLALTEWNDLSNALAGNAGLTLALNPADQVGVGTASPAATLDIARGTADGGTALFRGTARFSHFNYSTDEHTYIRGGKATSHVFLNDTGGHVGVGLTAPEATLDVARGTATWGTAVFRGTNRFSHFNYSSDEHTFIRGGKSNSHVYINDNGGNVGIGVSGTTAPTEKLEVNGNIKAGKFIGDGSQLTNLSVGATGLNLATASGSMVGIGTSNPQAKLHVAGGAIMPSAGNTDSSGVVFPKDPGGGWGDKAWLRYYARYGEAMTLELGIANDAGDHIAFMPSGYVGIGTNQPAAPLSIARADGKENVPDSAMHITSDCILFGGNNNGKESNSAQISAGKHYANSLNIVGMSSNTSYSTRRIDAWAEGGLFIRGNSNIFQIAMDNKKLIFTLDRSLHGGNSRRGISWDGDTNWDSYSDQKLKTDIENEENILERLLKLNVKNYRWIDNPKSKEKMIGFVAQDVKPLFPVLVGEHEDPETQETTLTLKYANFGVLAIGAIKELKQEYDKRIEKLEKEIASLKKHKEK